MPSAISTAANSFKKMFALVSPFFILLVFSPALIAPAAASPSAPTATVKRQAGAQFQRAEQLRATLNLKPVTKRTLGDYRQVVSSYRRVYLITPRANEVPEALMAIAQLYTEMGERFGRNYYQNAADSYRFLLREYPGNRHVPDAMLVCAKLQRDQLADYSGATQTYKDFLKRFPRSPRKLEAQEGVAELALLENSSKPSPDKEKDKATSDVAVAEAVLPKDESSDALPPSPTASHSVGIPRLRRIRSAVTEDATRVTIDLEDVVHYNSGRLENPERIFFDLREARLTSEVAREVSRENAHVDGDVLTAIRAAQNHAGVVRIVPNINRVKEYVASISPNPPQLLIDLYRKQPPPAILKIARASHNSSNIHETTDPHGPEAGNIELDGDGKSDTLVRTSQPAALKVSRTTSKSDLDQPAIAPQPTHDGQSTLTRALGLKIGRIVIDAGHGGHDTGTIGPTGLMEKDLCLDVALRLGKIIQQRLPGADVVYTRSDDTFIPLEERTHIANEAKADLFISIHANSSHDHGARGIETYYLNLKASPDAMEGAARETAPAQESVHDLEDLVKKIARSEKIDESREFAADIQDSLAKRIQKTYKPVKDRGVRKAPFVVLIGADMPSILTEISFLSNPADEQLLKKPDHRQRVAEGLYQGVASYLQSLNSMTGNLPKLPLTPAGRSVAAASVEQ